MPLEYYRLKTEHIHQEIAEHKRKKAEISHSTDVTVIDIKVVRSEIDEGRKYLTALRSENTTLANRLRELEEGWENLKFSGSRNEQIFTQEYGSLQAEYLSLQSAISGIHENNVSLQFEINTYRRLLEGNKLIKFCILIDIFYKILLLMKESIEKKTY